MSNSPIFVIKKKKNFKQEDKATKKQEAMYQVTKFPVSCQRCHTSIQITPPENKECYSPTFLSFFEEIISSLKFPY